MLEYGKKILQRIGGLEECGVSYLERETIVHPSMGLTIDEVKTQVVPAIIVATFLGNNPL